jgi:hypothetical protein
MEVDGKSWLVECGGRWKDLVGWGGRCKDMDFLKKK